MNKLLKYTANVSIVSGLFYYYNKHKQKNKYYSDEEIKKHNTEKDAWVSYKGNVYNITKFLDMHPGGKDKIMMAAGKPIEPFWEIYQQHYLVLGLSLNLQTIQGQQYIDRLICIPLDRT